MVKDLVKGLNTYLPLTLFVLSFTTFFWITLWFTGSFNREMFVQSIKSKYMSNLNSEQFGHPNYDYRSVKVGDKDAEGETIANILYADDKNIIYRKKGHLINSCGKQKNNFSYLNTRKEEIDNLLQSKIHHLAKRSKNTNQENELEHLYAYYAPKLARAYKMYDLGEYKKSVVITDEVKEDIEGKIKSQAQYTYSNYYLRYLIYIFGVVLVLIIWNELWFHKGIGNSLRTPNWLLGHIYIAAAGMIGSFISAKEKIATQTIDFYLPVKSTVLDVKMRLLLGGIFGIITFWLVCSGVITGLFEISLTSTFFAKEDKDSSQIILALLLGLVGGFSERLVPDTLQVKLKEVPSQEDKDKEAEVIARGLIVSDKGNS